MKPKIFAFITSYHPFVGGAEIALQEVAKRLSPELDFFIVTARMRRDLPKREIRPEGTVIRVGFGSRLDKYLLIFAPFHYRGLASIVMGVDISPASAAAAVYKLLHPRTPFVFNIQFGESEERLARGRAGLIGFAFRFMLIQADYVTAISSYLLDLARRHYGYEGPGEVIPNGVDVRKFQILNSKSETNSKFKIQNSKIIITTSRLAPKNGVDILIKAVAKVKKIIPDIQCWIVGDGEERKNLELEIRNLKLEDNIKLFGEVPYEKIPEYLHQADIFVRPSRSEGMGSSFVESLAAGLPIIGTPVGGITDIIKEGETGLFCRPDDSQDLAEKIVQLLGDRDLAARIIRQGRKMVEKSFSWDTIASAYRCIFKSYETWSHKIVVATPLFPPDIGGPATYSRTLVEELPRHEIGVEAVSFGTVRHFPKIIRHAIYFLSVLKAARRADIVFAQDPVSAGLPALFAARLLRKKFLLKVAGDYAWEQWQNREARTAKREPRFVSLEEFQTRRFDMLTELRRKIEHFVARRAEKIIVPSNYLKSIILQWGVGPEKITVIYNSFVLETVSGKEEARKILGLSGAILVSIGRLVPWKGFDALVKLMPEILPEFPEAKLIIIGDGPEEERIRAFVAERGLQERVLLLGRKSHEETMRYLAAADIFVLNTGYEGFSHLILEAMASGAAVITTRMGGNPELIENGTSGVLTNYNDRDALKKAILLLLKDEKLRRRLSEAAKTHLNYFTKDKMIENTYQWLCAS